MADETSGNQRVRAIRLDDEQQVRRWAAILGAPPPHRLSRRLWPYLGHAAKAVRPVDPIGRVGIGGRATAKALPPAT
jgi:hypothetical protein